MYNSKRCMVHFYHNFFVMPKSKIKTMAKMFKIIRTQESNKASREKAKAMIAELRHEAERGGKKGRGWHRGKADLL